MDGSPPAHRSAARRRPLPTIPVWDLPTRLFHWLLLLLMVVNIYTGNVGGVTEMRLHMLSGYAILTLMLFRIAWGFAGSRHSLFSDFVRGPAAVIAYARSLLGGAHRAVLGHNPLGGWSVVAMLVSITLQAVTGLFANDDILTEGPLAKWVSRSTCNALTEIHELNATVLYVLIAIHLAAVAGYLLVKGENLVRPMITGVKPAPAAAGGSVASFVSPWRAAILLAIAAAVVWFVVTR